MVALHTLLPQLVFLLGDAASAQQTGKQNTGGGLVGEIFGAGGPGAGGNGMEHAWDGQTSTWFDCLAPPDDFWDNCYTGIKLPAPTTIGQIRFCEANHSRQLAAHQCLPVAAQTTAVN